MPMIRLNQGEYFSTSSKKKLKLRERERDNFDLGWVSGETEYRIYVIDAHEWFDPGTSSKYDDGISRHAMYGPSLIVSIRHSSHCVVTEYYVNDPITWAWVRRCIAEKHLSSETMLKGVNSEDQVNKVKGPSTSHA